MKSSEIKSQVLAMMHGGAHVDNNHASGKSRLNIYHDARQLELLELKRDILESITGVTATIRVKNDGTCEGYRLQTNYSRYFYKLNTAPFKYVVKQLVRPKALAILWSDDGTLCIRSNGEFSSAVLCLDAWPLWQIDMLVIAWNRQYGWSPVVTAYKDRGTTYLRLRLIKEQAVRLSDKLMSYTVPALQYKLLPCKTPA